MKKILLIEDDLYNRELYSEVLTKAGYELSIATNGEDGYKLLMSGGYDLTILDVMLPKMDGLEIVKALSANKPDKPNGPIIFLTNLAQDRVMKEAQEFGVKDCLTKTDFNPDQLLDKISGYFRD